MCPKTDFCYLATKREYLHSKQQPTIDKSAEAQHAERVPLSAQKKSDCLMTVARADKGTRTPTPLGIRS